MNALPFLDYWMLDFSRISMEQSTIMPSQSNAGPKLFSEYTIINLGSHLYKSFQSYGIYDDNMFFFQHEAYGVYVFSSGFHGDLALCFISDFCLSTYICRFSWLILRIIAFILFRSVVFVVKFFPFSHYF